MVKMDTKKESLEQRCPFKNGNLGYPVSGIHIKFADCSCGLLQEILDRKKIQGELSDCGQSW